MFLLNSYGLLPLILSFWMRLINLYMQLVNFFHRCLNLLCKFSQCSKAIWVIAVQFSIRNLRYLEWEDRLLRVSISCRWRLVRCCISSSWFLLKSSKRTLHVHKIVELKLRQILSESLRINWWAFNHSSNSIWHISLLSTPRNDFPLLDIPITFTVIKLYWHVENSYHLATVNN